MHNDNWGLNSPKAVTDAYIKYAVQLKQLIKHSFSAAVYIQTTDVEIEVNGLMAYDREKIKIEEPRVRQVNTEIVHILD